MIKLSTDSLPTLRILARYAPEFPCLLGSLARFVPTVNKVLGKGTNQPGLHAQVIVVPSRGRYLPGKNTPVFGDNSGPHCYPVPFPGISLNDGAGGPAGSAQAPSSASKSAVTRAANTSLFSPTGPAGLAGSPAESELVRELAGLSLKQPPRSLPSWSGLLVAPLFRGSRVMVR
jgi:phospholipid/cholesterol/gamma-HCH transport system substrate-binding protein